MKRTFLFLTSILLLSACGGKARLGKPTIPYVRTLIKDASLPQHKLVSGYVPDRDGALYLLGSAGRCNPLRDKFLESDIYDNVDGSLKSDGLADFAGETICAVSDFANAPYRRFVEEGREEALREITVRGVLATMDTLCYVGEYDRSGMGRKPRAKVVVLASPYASEYGLYDVDSLFSALGCRLPVVSPLRVMLDRVFAGRNTDAMVGVISPKGDLASGSYTAFVQEISGRKGLHGSECVVFQSDTSKADPLIAFLDNYMAAGYTRPLDALLIDDYSLDAEAIALSFKMLTDPLGGQSLGYGNIFADDFRLLDARRAVVEECYRLLRGHNLFTHKIAQPKSLDFITSKSDSLDFIISQYAR